MGGEVKLGRSRFLLMNYGILNKEILKYDYNRYTAQETEDGRQQL